MWIVLTLAAAGFQIARTSEQHRLKDRLTVAEAGYVRFVYALPIALLFTTTWMLGPGTFTVPGALFWVSVGLGGCAQILATMALLRSFRLRDFAVGTLYAKTEVLFVGAGTAIFLSEPLAWIGWVGIVICLAGVMALMMGGRPAASALRFDPAALFGVLAAAGFAGAALGIRSASLSVDGTTAERAMTTLTAMLAIQTVVQGAALVVSSTSSVRAVQRAWRQSIGVAVLSLAGSAGWALAITLENAAKVRTLGQIEIIFAFAIGVIVHHETHTRREYAASVVTALGMLLIILA